MENVNPHHVTTAQQSSSATIFYRVVLFAAFIFFAFNLRAHITSVPSVVDYIKSDLKITSQTAGLLSTIPILCFGLMMPFMSWVVSKLGVDRALILTLSGIAVGVLVRSYAEISLAFLGTLIMGGAITMGNLISLMIIARDFKKYSDIITSIYVVAMSIGAMLTAGFTAPLAAVMGWQIALAVWSVFAFIAIGFWLIVFKLRKANSEVDDSAVTSEKSNVPIGAFIPAWKRLNVWLIALCFASHTFMFYSLTAWFPSYLQDVAQMSLEKAGSIASLFQIVSIIGCVLIPLLNRTGKFSRSMLFAVVAGSWLIMITGFLSAPNLWVIWLIFGGIASGGGFLVIFMLVMDLSRTMDENRSNSSFVQGIGYICASTGPTVVGSIHQHTESWNQSLIILPFLALMMLVMGMLATTKFNKTNLALQNYAP
ncbi:MAG TPA: MFS transporter [Psychromonas sp.]